MTRKERLLEKFKQNPENLRGSEVIKILENHGFIKEQGKWSHTLYKKWEIIFSLPIHNSDFKGAYKKRICKELFGKNGGQ